MTTPTIGVVHPQTVIRKQVTVVTVVTTGLAVSGVGAGTVATVQFANGDVSTAQIPCVEAYVPVAGDIAMLDLVAGSPVLVGSVSQNAGLPAQVSSQASTIGPTSGTTELTLVTLPTVTLDGRTNVKLTGTIGGYSASTVGDTFNLRIKEGATSLRHFHLRPVVVTQNTGASLSHVTSTPPAAGPHTYTLILVRTGGVGTATINGDTNQWTQLTIEQF